MAKEIKQKIVLEGEKEYNQAIKEAQRNLRTLKSELKAETAELGKNATEQQKAEAKIKSLKKQIAEQEKIVKTYTEALQEVREKYADNQDEIAKWEVKLNNARTALANMKSGLDEVGQGFQNVKGNAETGVVAAHSFAEAFGGLSDIGESISGTIEDIFTGVLSTVKAAVGELWELISDTAAKANRWTDVAGYWGTDAQTIQAYARAVAGSANSFDSLNSAVTKLVLGGDDKRKKITELLGISNVNYENQWEYAMAVMNRINEMTKSGRKMEPIYEQIFGAKKSTEVMDLINDWDMIQELVKQFNGDNGGYGLTSGMLADFDEIEVRIATVEEKWTGIKERFAGGFGNATLDILVNVESGLDALAKYFDADTPEEREAAMEELHEAILATFEAVADAIRDGIKILEDVSEELKQSNDPIVKGIGNILGGLVDALKWFTEDNAKNVVTALEIIAGFWLVGKGAAMANTIAGVVANIEVIKRFNALSGASGAAGAAGASGAAEAAGGSAAASGLGAAGMGGILGIVGIGASLFWAADRRKNHPEDVLGTEENLEKSTGGNTTLMDTFAQWVQAQAEWEKIENLTVEATEEEMEALQLKIKDLWEKLDEQEEFSKLWDSYNAWRQESGKSNTDWELPASWWQNGGTDTITGSDLQTFRGLPGQMQQAAKAGVAAGISGLRVTLDGRTVGALVAPYVSEYIGQEMDG